MEGRMQTKTEEILNAITHAAGIVLYSGVLLPIILVFLRVFS